MKIVFLGGTGFVGAHAVRKLADLGHDVTVAHLGHTEPDLPASVRHVHHPSAPNGRFGRHGQFLTDVADELRGLEWDVAVDMNPESDVDAGIVMETFRHVARRVVAISSMDVYRGYAVMHRRDPGPPQPVTFTEESDLREQLFIDAPGVDKILAERVFLGDSALPSTILRWPMVYGPRDPQHRLLPYLRQMDAGRPYILVEENLASRRRSRGYSESVALSVVLAVTDERATGHVYNVAEADALTEMEWVQEIGRAAGWNGKVATVPRDDAPPHLVPSIDTRQDWVVDTSNIRDELGYAEPVPRPDALRRTAEWERANLPSSGTFPSDDEMASRYAAEDALLRKSIPGTDMATPPA